MSEFPQDLSDFSMMDIFRMEAETQMALLNDNLLAVESNPDMERSALDERLEVLMRAAHSIKGAARIVGLDLAVQVAHALEDCFVAAQESRLHLDASAVDVLLGGVDWFESLSRIANDDLPTWLNAQTDTVNTLVAAIAGLLQTQAEPSPAPTPQPAPPPPPVTEERPPTQDANGDRVVRVSADKLNQLMALAGESLVNANWLQPFTDALLHLKQQQQEVLRLLDLVQQDTVLNPLAAQHLSETRQKAADCQTFLGERIGDLEHFSQRFSQLSDNLYRELIASHMRPFADGVQGFPRTVRDLGKQLGKSVKLEIVGSETPVDRDILEKLEAPLTQILRNAIVHGIEPPEERRQLGKAETGLLRLEATHRAGMLSITASDDGRGIDLERLRQKIVEKQLAAPEFAAQLSEVELLEFLFLPGFSTAETVTENAGRGVGLDIAKSMVREVGGLLRVNSEAGEGLSFHFQLPLTLSVIRALLVEIAGELYAFALSRIDRVLTIDPQTICVSENRPYIVVENQNISLVKAQQVLELPDPGTAADDKVSVVVVSDSTHRYGAIVDRFVGEKELVVRPLDPRLGKVQDISAAAVTEEGLPLLILDVADLVRSIDRLVSQGNIDLSSQQVPVAASRQKRVLVVDDSITVREMERKLLQNRGYHVDVAVNGMEGWNAVRSGHYDLVISDIDMPRMNGIELVQHIKRHPQLQSLPTIVVSYKDRQEDRLAGLEAGADYYLTKSSFHDNRLLEAVADLIGE